MDVVSTRIHGCLTIPGIVVKVHSGEPVCYDVDFIVLENRKKLVDHHSTILLGCNLQHNMSTPEVSNNINYRTFPEKHQCLQDVGHYCSFYNEGLGEEDSETCVGSKICPRCSEYASKKKVILFTDQGKAIKKRFLESLHQDSHSLQVYCSEH